MTSTNFSTWLYRGITLIMILAYAYLFLMVVKDDAKYQNTVTPENGGKPVIAPAPPENQLVTLLFTGLTTAFAIYTGKILGIELKKPNFNYETLSLRDKIKRVGLSIWEGLGKANLPKIGALLFVIATTLGFFFYLVEIRQVPGLSDEPISNMLKDLASSFVGLILGFSTSGDEQ